MVSAVGAFSNAVQVLFKRPSVVLFFALVTLIFTLINYFVPVFAIIHSLGSIGESNIYESLVSFLQLAMGYLSSVRTGLIALFMILGFLFILSAILSFLFSGFFSIINNALAKKPKQKGEFITGVRKHFSKVVWINFRVLIAALILLIYLMVVMVPAAIITRTASIDKPQLIISAVFIDILTLGIVFFALMFFRIYVMFWYPAAISLKKKPFSTGKRIADAYFWQIVKVLLVFDAVYLIIHLLLAYAGGKAADASQGIEVVLLALKWIFETLFFSVFATYIFSLFRQLAGANGKSNEHA